MEAVLLANPAAPIQYRQSEGDEYQQESNETTEATEVLCNIHISVVGG